MRFSEYLMTRNYWQSSGFSKEEYFLRKRFDLNSRNVILEDVFLNEEILDEELKKYEEYLDAKKKSRLEKNRIDLNLLWNAWCRENVRLLRSKSKKAKVGKPADKLWPNYLFEYDILPLSQALKRGLYRENGLLNVFRDPTFVPKWGNVTSFRKMIASRGLVIYEYFDSQAKG